MEEIAVSPETQAHNFVRSINRRDPDELAAIMSPGHRLVDSLDNLVEGREKVRAAWVAYFRMVPDYSLAIEETYSDGPVSVMLGMAGGTFTRDGKLRPENRWRTPVAIRAYIEDGLVAEWRVYADNEPMRELMR